MRESQAMTCAAHVKPRVPPSLCPALKLNDKPKVIENNDNVLDAPVEMHGFNKTAYKFFEVWVRICQIPDVQHCRCEVDPLHAADM